MPQRNLWRWFDYHAICRECGWELRGKNALGVAARHHDKTGHSVYIEVEGSISYLNDADHAAKSASRDST